MSTTPLTAVARSKVHILSLRLERDDYGRKVARLRLRQPSSGAVVQAVATKPALIDALFQGGRGALWSAIIDRADRANLVLVDAKVQAAG